MRKSLRFQMVAATVGIALLAGCTINPYTGEKQASKAGIGAAIGAAGGATVGALTGDNNREKRKRALIGAGVGALAGGGIGYYMDVQEAKLRRQLEGTGVSVTRVGDDIVLNMPGNVTFQTARSDINSDFFDVLNSVALVLKEFDKTIIEVAGHTDNTGPEDFNQRLSEKRATSVGQYLKSQGIPEMRILTLGYGELRPISSNTTQNGRQQNRRVELTLAPSS